MYLFQYLHIPT